MLPQVRLSNPFLTTSLSTRNRQSCHSLSPLVVWEAVPSYWLTLVETLKLKYRPRGICLRAACRMVSRSLKLSNFTTIVLGLLEWLLPVILCARSMCISVAWFSEMFNAETNDLRITASVSTHVFALP